MTVSDIAHCEEGRAHSLPPNPRPIAPRICSDLITPQITPMTVAAGSEKTPAAVIAAGEAFLISC
jgi:hypothetical protein